MHGATGRHALGATARPRGVYRLADHLCCGTPPLPAMGMQLLVGSVPLALLAIALEEPSGVLWSMSFVVSLLGLALGGTALVYWLWFRLLARVELGRANADSFLVPVFGFGMGVLFFGERADAYVMLGSACIVTGIVLASRGGVSIG